MNETLKVIAERFSCRSFTDKKVDDASLQAIAQAAIQAPSGMNRQGWQVIVLKNQEIIADMEATGMAILKAQEDSSTYDRMMSRGGTMLYNAPCMVIIAVPGGVGTTDCGIVAQNVALAAESLGINTLHCGLLGMVFAGDKGEEFKQKLQFPEGYGFGLAVLLGYGTAQGMPHELNQDKITVIA